MKKTKKAVSLELRLKNLNDLTWDELSYEIIKLNLEFENNKKKLKESEIQLYQQFISSYEKEKVLKFPQKRNYAECINGPRNAIVDWLEVEIDQAIGLVNRIGDS